MDEAVTFQEELRVTFISTEVEWPEREEGRMEVSVVKLMSTDRLPALWLDLFLGPCSFFPNPAYSYVLVLVLADRWWQRIKP